MLAMLTLFLLLLQSNHAVIYSLEDLDKARIPPLMHMDSYELCQLDTDAMYCSAEFVLVSDRPSPLLDKIKGYSEHRVTHFNRTHLRYGICITQTCKKFYKNENKDLKLILEACLNETLYEKYELKVKILDEYFCRQPKKPELNTDLLDIIVATICLLLVIANVVGSLCDVYCNKMEVNRVIEIVLCFSLKRNWNKLAVNKAEGSDARFQLLKSIHGVRALTMVLVIFGHTIIVLPAAIGNPEFLEQIYSFKPLYVFLNGTLIMQTFLMISSFLLIYIWLIYSENHKESWSMLPKLIIFRWLRITPSYALILALTSTWFRHLASGPLWEKYVMLEMKDCRQYWWRHIVYINNYLPSTCMVQSWYLAADTQLYIGAVIIYLACRTATSRKIVLLTLFIFGSLVTIAHIYFQDLDGTLLISPETLLGILSSRDQYFNNVYMAAHTNIVGYISGMATAFVVYHWQKQEINIKKYKILRYRLLFWFLLPMGMLCSYSGAIFYDDASRASVFIRIVYAVLSKPIFTIFVTGIIVGCIFKIEDFYRSILEWQGWKIPSRLSYSAYLLHLMFIRTYLASVTQVTQQNYFNILQFGFIILIVTFVASFFFWMLVEAPLSNVIYLWFKIEKEEEKKQK